MPSSALIEPPDTGFTFSGLASGIYALNVLGYATGSSGGFYAGGFIAETAPVPEPETYACCWPASAWSALWRRAASRRPDLRSGKPGQACATSWPTTGHCSSIALGVLDSASAAGCALNRREQGRPRSWVPRSGRGGQTGRTDCAAAPGPPAGPEPSRLSKPHAAPLSLGVPPTGVRPRRRRPFGVPAPGSERRLAGPSSGQRMSLKGRRRALTVVTVNNLGLKRRGLDATAVAPSPFDDLGRSSRAGASRSDGTARRAG